MARISAPTTRAADRPSSRSTEREGEWDTAVAEVEISVGVCAQYVRRSHTTPYLRGGGGNREIVDYEGVQKWVSVVYQAALFWPILRAGLGRGAVLRQPAQQR